MKFMKHGYKTNRGNKMILNERLFESINIENKQKLDQLISKAYNNEISLETFYNELQNFDNSEKDKALADFVIYKKKIHSSKTDESLKEDITEPAQETTSTESQKESGLTAIVNSLINDENEAIDGYNSAIVNFEVEGRGDLTEVFRSILAEEQVHIGELQTVLNKINPETVSNIEDGQQEAQETLDNNIDIDKETV